LSRFARLVTRFIKSTVNNRNNNRYSESHPSGICDISPLSDLFLRYLCYENRRISVNKESLEIIILEIKVGSFSDFYKICLPLQVKEYWISGVSQWIISAIVLGRGEARKQVDVPSRRYDTRNDINGISKIDRNSP